MDLGDRERPAIALPGFGEDGLMARDGAARTNRLDVDVRVAAVATGADARVQIEPIIEPSIARQVVVEADDLRWTRVVDEPGQVV